LLEIAGRDSERFKTVWELIKDDLFLADFSRILAPAVANRERGSLRDRVEGVWLALGGPACVADKTELEDAERYLDELERLEEQGPITDLTRLHDALERLYALPDVDATDADLQIMTIHKAKGLEFGTVIVPGLDLGPGGGDPDLLLFNEVIGPPSESGGLLLAPIKATGAETDPTYRYLRDLNADAEDVESSRLLYVAATRAEKRLHLMACLGCDKDGELKRPAAHTLLSRAWSAAERPLGRRKWLRRDRFHPSLAWRAAGRCPQSPMGCHGACRRNIAKRKRSSSHGPAKQRGTSARWSTAGSSA
jgi:ATP-dependent helicase/nuclease subunit A